MKLGTVLSISLLCGCAVFVLVVMCLEWLNGGQLLLHEVPQVYYWEFPLVGIAIIASIGWLLKEAFRK